MNNRVWNCKNPHQGNSKKVLCVCSAGLLRSPTIAHVLTTEHKYNTRAVGSCKGYALIPIDSVLIEWCDEIVVSDKSVETEINKHFSIEKPIINLGLPDIYPYMDDTLITLIKEKYTV